MPHSDKKINCMTKNHEEKSMNFILFLSEQKVQKKMKEIKKL